MNIFSKFVILIYTILSMQSNLLAGEDVFNAEIFIKDHKFYPEQIEVPAGRKIRLTVHNQDDTIEEFESIDLKREKIIPGNSLIHIVLAPLKPGRYYYFGEFHQETAKGYIEVKD